MSPFSDEGTETFIHEILAPAVEGATVRVRVLSTRCAGCGEEWWPFGEGVTYTLLAAALRALATQAHTDECMGPMQFETEPE